jgi:ribosomal protein S18 acetylase RimI-like enzyme
MTTPAPTITLRPATEADAPQLHASLLGIARAVDGVAKLKSSVEDLVRHGFGPERRFEAVIAEVDGTFAGMCIFFPSFSSWLGKPGVYVQDLYVDDHYRGLGIGRSLLRRVAAMTRDRGGCYLRLSVDTENRAAQEFYQRLDVAWSDTEQIHAAYGEAFLNLAAADSPPAN